MSAATKEARQRIERGMMGGTPFVLSPIDPILRAKEADHIPARKPDEGNPRGRGRRVGSDEQETRAT